MQKYFAFWTTLIVLVFPALAQSAPNTNALIFNEGNAVSGSNFLKSNGGIPGTDATLGRLQGNGQNWMEFLVTRGTDLGGGNYANTLDLRGWKLDWSYHKDDNQNIGSGEITFTNDPLWAAVPQGTMLSMSEWLQAYYQPGSDPGGGLDRTGGVTGIGLTHGTTGTVTKSFASDTVWNPTAGGGGANADWLIHVFAGQNFNAGTNTSQYFHFTGSVTTDGGVTNSPIGTDAGGLFAVNNDNWQLTIKDASGQVIEGPIGEAITGFGLGSDEIIKLEGFTGPATQAQYLGVTPGNYNDGTSSTYNQANKWDSGTSTQDLSGLRSWLNPADYNLDGKVNIDDGSVLVANWNGPGSKIFSQGDSTGDGHVNIDDGSVLVSHWTAAHDNIGTGLASITYDNATGHVTLDANHVALYRLDSPTGLFINHPTDLGGGRWTVSGTTQQYDPQHVAELALSNSISAGQNFNFGTFQWDYSGVAQDLGALLPAGLNLIPGGDANNYVLSLRYNTLGGQEAAVYFVQAPEPSTIVLAGLAGVALVVAARRRKVA